MDNEPRVSVVGPSDLVDVYDVATGLRFVQGMARDVPLSLAKEIERTRRGYYIQGSLRTSRQDKGEDNG